MRVETIPMRWLVVAFGAFLLVNGVVFGIFIEFDEAPFLPSASLGSMLFGGLLVAWGLRTPRSRW